MSIVDKLTTIAENQQRIYDAGVQAEYDAFWDEYQLKGARTYYPYAFANYGWSDKNFYPKYDITATASIDGLFYLFGRNGNKVAEKIEPFDLAQRLEDCGVRLIFKNLTSAYRLCMQAQFSRVPEMDLSTAPVLDYMFAYVDAIKTVDKLIISENGSQTWGSAFYNCTALENITFEGIIGNNIDFRYSPLTKDSIMGKLITSEKYEVLSDNVKRNNVYVFSSVLLPTPEYYYGGVITALSSAPSVTGKTLTLKKSAVDEAFCYPSAKNLDYTHLSVGDIDVKTDEFVDYLITRDYTIGMETGNCYTLHFSDVSVIVEKTGDGDRDVTVLYSGNGDYIMRCAEMWKSLVAAKPNWTISLV